ncbi:hypothetical protein [Microcoleus sp. bin38.metabat.b11b12b14.051]|uniref:hypothetical protein n=1 Tax=Microcoleus sp. bin38.metabat.b11b12b14.051 TaxID=2742709 RepID=UPI0026004B10|nr:hypothetical protein [Microcoleus sp. bin38.metabat.b11b12b14.051]
MVAVRRFSVRVPMISDALGDAAVVLFASLFAGLFKQAGVLLSKPVWVMGLGNLVLVVAGVSYLVTMRDKLLLH